jgi:hypothetical protein
VVRRHSTVEETYVGSGEILFIRNSEPGVVAQAHNPSTQEAEAEDQVWASLGYIGRPCLKKHGLKLGAGGSRL